MKWLDRYGEWLDDSPHAAWRLIWSLLLAHQIVSWSLIGIFALEGLI